MHMNMCMHMCMCMSCVCVQVLCVFVWHFLAACPVLQGSVESAGYVGDCNCLVAAALPLRAR